jgi:hypothetical protein
MERESRCRKCVTELTICDDQDLVYLRPDTSARIFINQRGSRDDGSGLKPHWVEADAGSFTGWPDDPKVNTSNIMFGRVFGSGRTDVSRLVYQVLSR